MSSVNDNNYKENTLYLSKTEDAASKYCVLMRKELTTGAIIQVDILESDLPQISGSDLAEFQGIKDII